LGAVSSPNRRLPSRPRRLSTPAIFVAIALLVLAAAGCERRAQDSPSAGEPAAHLLVTSGHGERVHLRTTVPPGQSSMRALRGATDVRTAYGGGFVAEMFGLASDTAAQRDWFLFVNGVLSPVGAREVALADGDRIWWDHRAWGALSDPWAVVGSWPAPFTTTAPGVLADAPLDDVLAGAGATLTDDPAAPWRVRVGAHQRLLEREPAWAAATADPAGGGLSARFEDGAIVALDAESGEARPVAGAAVLVAAVPADRFPTDGVVLVVAGVDDEAARAGAEALADDPELVAGAYAAVLDREGRLLAAGGREAG
jgi:hypothetical protein